MTSEEIRSTPSAGEELRIAECMWLREIALQLALFNERNAALDAYRMEQDAKDAEREANKPNVLAEFLERANGTLDRIAPEPVYRRMGPGPGSN